MDLKNAFVEIGRAEVDKVINVKRTVLADCGGDFSVVGAEVTSRMAPHVHFTGPEVYLVLEGTGLMHLGKAVRDGERIAVDWDAPFEVGAGDCFVIPQSTAHFIESTYGTPVKVCFILDLEHLKGDRILVDFPQG